MKVPFVELIRTTNLDVLSTSNVRVNLKALEPPEESKTTSKTDFIEKA